jgi:hypothetical protein
MAAGADPSRSWKMAIAVDAGRVLQRTARLMTVVVEPARNNEPILADSPTDGLTLMRRPDQAPCEIALLMSAIDFIS